MRPPTPKPTPILPRSQPPESDEHTTPDRVPWPLWTAPAVVAFGFLVGVLASILVGIVAAVGGSNPTHPTPAVSIIDSFVFDLGFVVATLWLVSRGRPLRPADFGFRRVRLSTAVRALVPAAIAYYGLSAIYASIFRLHGTDKLPSSFGIAHSTAALVAASVFVCAVAPIAEELFFRGFLFGTLRKLTVEVAGRDLGPWIAAVVTGILFGLAHTGSASSQYLIPLGFLGFVLCLVRWRTGSLYPCMALHSANNALALGVNQLHWNGAEIAGLITASWLVIAAITGPLGARSPALVSATGRAR